MVHPLKITIFGYPAEGRSFTTLPTAGLQDSTRIVFGDALDEEPDALTFHMTKV
jgi:hypothetical protein